MPIIFLPEESGNGDDNNSMCRHIHNNIVFPPPFMENNGSGRKERNMKTNFLIRFIKKCDIIGLAMLTGAAAAILYACFLNFTQRCEAMPEEVLRLHILANSDSEEDQNLKYGLRDFLLSDLSGVFSDAENLEDAEKAAEDNLSVIEKLSESYVGENGYTYNVKAELAEMYFTTRVYGSVTMPAGNYKALRIIIGEGKGKNWWCVLFPPLCLPAASKSETDLSKADFFYSKEASKAVESGENGIEIRFAIFEWLESFFGKKVKRAY